jgi:hypothetical protein
MDKEKTKKITISKSEWENMRKIASDDVNIASDIASTESPAPANKKLREAIATQPLVILSESILNAGSKQTIVQAANELGMQYTAMDFGIVLGGLVGETKYRFNAMLLKMLDLSNTVVNVSYSIEQLSSALYSDLQTFIARNRNELQNKGVTIVGSVGNVASLPSAIRSMAMIIDV